MNDHSLLTITDSEESEDSIESLDDPSGDDSDEKSEIDSDVDYKVSMVYTVCTV